MTLTDGSDTSPDPSRASWLDIVASITADLATDPSLRTLRASVHEHLDPLLTLERVFVTIRVGDALHAADDEQGVARFPPFGFLPLEVDLPLTEAARTCEPVVASGRHLIDERYPLARGSIPHVHSIVALPVVEHGVARAVVSFWFREAFVPQPDELSALTTLAGLFVALTRVEHGDVTHPAPDTGTGRAVLSNVVQLRALPEHTGGPSHTGHDELPADAHHDRSELEERLASLEREVASVRELLRFLSAIVNDSFGAT